MTGTLGAEKAGGKLSGLLAEEKEFDRRALWRIGWWGLAALCTLIVAVLANQGAQSWRQERIAAADLARQTQLLQSLARDTQNESRRLAAAIETLNKDRDTLYARVTVLEQSLDSVTGALSKQGASQAMGTQAKSSAVATSPVPAAPSTQLAAADAQATAANLSAPSPTGSPSAVDSSTAAPTGTAAPRSDLAKFGGNAMPTTGSQPSGSAIMAMAAAVSANPAPVKPQSAWPAEANAKPVEATEAVTEAVHKTEFAVDLGGANSINGLRALWRGLAKTNSDLAPLQPIIMLKEGNNGAGMQLRLGAGPLSDAAAAAKICASLSETQRPCETTVYDGQRLATRDDEAGPAGQKPASNAAAAQRRRVSQQRHGAVREQQQPQQPQQQQPAAAPPSPAEQPKPAEPATLSSLFRRP